MIEIRCYHTLEEAAPYRQAINALNLASARPDPFSTFEFYENHLRYSPPLPAVEHSRLWLLLAFSGEELVGYAALKHGVHRVLGLRAAKVDWLTAHEADRPHLVARAEQAGPVGAALYAYLLGRKNEWSLLEFQQQDATSSLLSPPAGATSHGCRFLQWINPVNGTIPVRWRSTAEYFAALSKKSRSNVSRQMRSLLAAGEVQVLTSADPQALPTLFELCRSIEPHSWKSRTDASVGGERQPVEYYTGLMDPAQPMRLVIQVLLLNGVPVAGLINGAFNGGLYALHIVHDGRLDRLAPGSAILLMGVRLAIEGGYAFFNLLRGSGYYKARWLAQLTDTRSLQIYRVGTPFFWRRALGDARRRWSGTAVAKAGVLFNPERRELGAPAQEGAASAWLPGPEERAEQAGRVAQALRGPGEMLSARQLAAVLPFATQRPAPPAAECAVANG